jgi:hypothetical protein
MLSKILLSWVFYISVRMVYSTRIKVSDLLLNVWESDEIDFSGLMIDAIAWLDDKGISWKLHLQSIDNSTIIATLEALTCHIHEISDVSATSYVRDVSPESFSAYFVIDPSAQTYNEDDDAPVFPIDPKNLTIDTKEMVYQCILLDTPFVKRTPEEEATYASADPDNLDAFDNEAGGQIVFRKAK